MSFTRAKIQRFNEVCNCAPPPGTYEPHWNEKAPLGIIDKVERFKEQSKTDGILPDKVRPLKTPVKQKKMLKTTSTAKKTDKNEAKLRPDLTGSSARKEMAELEQVDDGNMDHSTNVIGRILSFENKDLSDKTPESLIEEKEDRVMNLESKMSHLEDELDDLKKSNATLTERLSSLQEKTLEYRLQIVELQDELNSVTAERNELLFKHEESIKDYKELEKKAINLEKIVTETQAKSVAQAELTDKVNVLSQELAQKKREIDSLNLQLMNVRDDFSRERLLLEEDYKKKITEGEEISQEKDKKIESLEKSIDKISNEFKVQADTLNNTTSSLTNMKQYYDIEVHCRKETEKELSIAEMNLEKALSTVQILTKENQKLKMNTEEIFHKNLEKKMAAKDDYIHELESLIGPFKSQLEMYEHERQALQSLTVETRGKLEKLSLEHAAALGHQNHKQKIRHLVQLKEHNLKLQEEIRKLNIKMLQKEKIIEKLSTSANKEDLTYCSTKALQISAKENSFTK